MLDNQESILETHANEDVREEETPTQSLVESRRRKAILDGRIRRDAPGETPAAHTVLENHRPSILESRASRDLADEPEVGPNQSILEGRRRSILSGRRIRPLPPDANRPRRGRRFLWSLAIVLFIAVAAVAAYSYWAVEAYRGKVGLLPAIQERLVADGQRIDAAERSVVDQRNSWGGRLVKLENRLDGASRVARGQARVQDDLDHRTTALEGRVDNVESAQRSSDQRLNDVQGQVDQLRSPAPAPEATPNSTPPIQDQEAVPDRISFESGLHRMHEISPIVRLDVTRVDTAHQRFDGLVRLADGRTLPIRDRGPEQPLKFYRTGSDTPDELVVTRVTDHSVVGYLQTSRSSAPVAKVAAVAQSR